MIPFLDLAGARHAVEAARARARALKGAALGLGLGGQSMPFFVPAAGLFLLAETIARPKVVCPGCGVDVHAWGEELERREGVALPPIDEWMACPACGVSSAVGRELLAPATAPERGAVVPRRADGQPAPSVPRVAVTGPLVAARGPDVPLEPGALPWTPGLPAAPPPAGVAYGFWHRRSALPAADADELRRLCDGDPPVAVWTPETAGWARPEEVPSLVDAVRAGHARRVARGLLPPLCFSAGASLAAALLAAVWGVPPSFRSMPVFLALAGLVYAAVAWREAAAARRVTPEGFRGEFFAAIHAGWIAERPAHLTRFLTVCIAAVGLLQLTARSRSLHVAGLLEPAVEAGEWWRVVTGGLVHGDELHFLVNFMALQQLGRLLEVHAHRALLPLVFLVSVVTGSAAELLLTDAFSVGASGGLLGMIGFLGVASVRRAGVLPHGFRKTIVTDLAAIAAVGLVGAAVIANAGHLGGLLGGAALGLLLVPSVAARPGIGWTPALPVRMLGWAAAAGVALAAAWTAALILGRV